MPDKNAVGPSRFYDKHTAYVGINRDDEIAQCSGAGLFQDVGNLVENASQSVGQLGSDISSGASFFANSIADGVGNVLATVGNSLFES